MGWGGVSGRAKALSLLISILLAQTCPGGGCLWSVGGRWRVSEQPFSPRGPAHPGGRLGCAARSWPADRILSGDP